MHGVALLTVCPQVQLIPFWCCLGFWKALGADLQLQIVPSEALHGQLVASIFSASQPALFFQRSR